MAKKVKDFYLGPTPLEPSTPEGLVNAISDSSYAHPVDTAAKVLKCLLGLLWQEMTKSPPGARPEERCACVCLPLWLSR